MSSDLRTGTETGEQHRVEQHRVELRRGAQYRDRWTTFGARTGILELSERLSAAELRRYEIFQGYDDAFLNKLSPDVSVARWQAGTLLFEEGSYLDLAFFIVEGAVEVFLSRHAAPPPIFDAERTSLFSAQLPLVTADVKAVAPATGITFLATLDFELPASGRAELGPGELLGEIGAMSGWPQSVTARVLRASTLVQIRLPALRAMRRASPAFKERLDAVYRRRSLADHLRATPLLAPLGVLAIGALTEAVELISCEPGEVIAREGEPADALYLVRSGFVQLAQRWGAGEIVVNYLSKGMTFGEIELLAGQTGGFTASAASVEHAELVRIPRLAFDGVLRGQPALEAQLWEGAVARLRETGASRRNPEHAQLIETALERGLVQGNSILVIDLERCTRCDDCVRACAATHGGRPRFVREGDKIANLQVAHACYHCRDPVCLVGCPTGAIRRSGVGHVVAIDENLCIGCQTCARSCPYDAIVMHETGETWPDDMIPEHLRGAPRLVASKCDLCHTSEEGPACVKNCPNGCAYRIGSLEELELLLDR